MFNLVLLLCISISFFAIKYIYNINKTYTTKYEGDSRNGSNCLWKQLLIIVAQFMLSWQQKSISWYQHEYFILNKENKKIEKNAEKKQ